MSLLLFVAAVWLGVALFKPRRKQCRPPPPMPDEDVRSILSQL